jgi:hypothetical protein
MVDHESGINTYKLTFQLRSQIDSSRLSRAGTMPSPIWFK